MYTITAHPAFGVRASLGEPVMLNYRAHAVIARIWANRLPFGLILATCTQARLKTCNATSNETCNPTCNATCNATCNKPTFVTMFLRASFALDKALPGNEMRSGRRRLAEGTCGKMWKSA